jgi:diacylglycerol kinase family enzyme
VRFVAVLNKDGGTLRTTNLDAFSDRISTAVESQGGSVDILVVPGDEVVETLKKAASSKSVDVLIAAGGDGTISAAASILMNKKIALAVLPAGTMNLFARSLGVNQTLEAAVDALSEGEIRAVDIATANGVPFVHQFSIGLHAKMVHLRDRMEFKSRLGKIGASIKAAYQTVLNPPSLKVTIEVDGDVMEVRTTGIGVSNNLFGEGHLPYSDTPDGGVLGVYVTLARQRGELLRLGFDMMRGRWGHSQHVDLRQGQKVVLRLPAAYRRFKCVIDGELRPLERETVLEIHPGALNVFAPKASARAEAA